MALLTNDEVSAHLEMLKDWTVEGNALTRVFVFAGFPEAVAFVSRLVPEAESADHHPDIAINYRRVTLRWTTHSEGGLTLKDVDGARMADRHARLPAG
jgi:4a-hydroxytetrahydrobiopterin dehydratase